jgi:hypothetical protein
LDGVLLVTFISLSLDGVVLMAYPLSLDGVVLLTSPLSLVLGWGVFAKMGWEEIHSLSQAQFSLVLCKDFMFQFNIGNYWNKWDLSWTEYKKT